MGSSLSVHPLLVLFATLAATVLCSLGGTIFAAAVVATTAVVSRYLCGALLFKRRQKALVVGIVVERAPRIAAFGEEPTARFGDCCVEGEG